MKSKLKHLGKVIPKADQIKIRGGDSTGPMTCSWATVPKKLWGGYVALTCTCMQSFSLTIVGADGTPHTSNVPAGQAPNNSCCPTQPDGCWNL